MAAELYTEHDALKAAALSAMKSPCSKSKRGAAIFHRRFGLFTTGFNHPPEPMRCDGSAECRKACNKLCIHAEEHALLRIGIPLEGYEMVHVKVVGGDPTVSGPPSCWQCSRDILAARLRYMWLLHEDGLRAYTPLQFHQLTLETKDIYTCLENTNG